MPFNVPIPLQEVEEVRGEDFIALEAISLLPFFQEERWNLLRMNKVLDLLLLHEEKCVPSASKEEEDLTPF